MTTTNKENETIAVFNSSRVKTAWHQPTISRIDIKRTMFGAGPYNDGDGGQMSP